MSITRYVDAHITALLEAAPFNAWPVERSVEDDLDEPRIDYVFQGHGLSLICGEDEIIHTIFLYADERGGFREPLFEIALSLSRDEVLAHFGAPSKSGSGTSDPILGEFGPWDRFERPGLAIHVEYRPGSDAIRLITLMRSDVVP